MARLVGPDEGSRLAYGIRADNTLTTGGGLPVTVYADAGATTLADILTHPGGVVVPGSVLSVGASSLLPLFQFPDGVDVVYVSANGGPVSPVYARNHERLDAAQATADAAETPAGAQAKASAAQVAAQAASAQRAANLSDLANAATARTNLGLGNAATRNVGTTAGTVAQGDDSRITGAQSKYVSAAAAANTRGLLMRMRRGVEDARILVVGDSTGNETTEWVYLLAQYLAQQFPAYTVTFRFWNESTETDYQPPVTVQTGSGPRTLSVYNASRAGASTDYLLGTRYANAITAANPDLVLINHGHNTSAAASSDYASNVAQYYALHSVASDIALTFPFAPITYIAQNPSATPGRETWQANKATMLETLAGQYGWGVIDVHQAFVDYGNWQAELTNADGIHPNAAGQAIWASVVQASFTDGLNATPQRVRPSPLSVSAPNLLLNAAFDSWASTDPDQWAMTLCTSAKDTATFETGTDAMKLTATGTGTSFAQQAVASTLAPRLKGKWVTVAARVWVPVANTATVRLTLVDSTGGANGKNADLGPSQRGRWQWVWVSKLIDPAATSVSVRLGCRTSGTATVDATWDRVWLGEGVTPFAPA